MARFSKEQINEELKAHGFSYYSGEYVNLSSVINVACDAEAHIVPATLKQIRTGKFKCPACDLDAGIQKKESHQDTPPKKNGVRLLALDNATNKTGYAVFENGVLISYGVKTTSKDMSVGKISELRQWFLGMINLWEVDYIGLENVQYQGNPQVLILLSKLLGVLEVSAFEKTGKAPEIVVAGSWKSFAKIKGRTRVVQKEGAQNFVKEKFGIVATQDACDAICLGLYACNRVQLNTMMEFGK